MDYTIERNGVAATPNDREIAMIQAADLPYTAADDLPGGVEFARLRFGGIDFKVYRTPDRPWPTIRNCNFASREDDLGRHVLEALAAADRGCDDCDLIGALDALENTLIHNAECGSAEAEEACTDSEEAVEAALLAINAAFDKAD